MNKRFSVLSIVFLLTISLGMSRAFADVDVPDFQRIHYPEFVVDGQNYQKLETEEFLMDCAVNNLIVAVDGNISKTALFRGYIRFRYEKNQKWTSYLAFDQEYHFSSVDPVGAYQMMFVARDP